MPNEKELPKLEKLELTRLNEDPNQLQLRLEPRAPRRGC